MGSYTIYLLEVYLFTSMLFLVGKDATSYLLKAKTDDSLSANRVKRWHRDGFILYALFIAPCLVIAGNKWYWIIAGATLIRATFYDTGFNYWASLPIDYLGGTAWWDKLFVKIFGLHGGLRKAGFFNALLITLQYFIYKY